MAAAGPAGNLAIALVAFAALKVGLGLGWFEPPNRPTFEAVVHMSGGAATAVTTTLSIFLVLNVLLCMFNLIPLPPLDGASVLAVLLPAGARDRFNDMASSSMASLLGLIVAWRVFPMVVGPLFRFVVRVLHPGVYG
jgi:Zn-dependent protease